MSLKFQLIPQMFKNINLHNEKIRIIEPDKWKEISSKVRDEQKECHYCGRGFVRFELEAHEVWVFDKVNHVQKLVDIVSACKLCHHTIHYDNFHSEKWKHKNYYMAINDCTNSTFERELKAAQDKADIGMEDNDWKLDISYILERGYAELQDINIENLEDVAIGSSRFLIGIPKKSNAEKAAMLLDECKVLEDSRNEIDLKILGKRREADRLISLVRTGKEVPGVDAEKVLGEVHKKWMIIHDIEREIKDLIQNPDALVMEEKEEILPVQIKKAQPCSDKNREDNKLKLLFNVIPKKCLIDYANEYLKNIEGNCQICNNHAKRLYRYWDFKIENYGELKLMGWKYICPLCRDTIFWGTEGLFQKTKITTKHYMKVNQCDYETYKQHRKMARELCDHNNRLRPFIYLKIAGYIPRDRYDYFTNQGVFFDCRSGRWVLRPNGNLHLFRNYL